MIVHTSRFSRSSSFALVLATGSLLAAVNGCTASDLAAAEAAVADAGTATAAADGGAAPATTTQPTVTLSANAQSFTTAGSISLTATVTGGTPSAVSFFDGAQQLGQTATAPFTQSQDIAFPDNGVHNYIAKAIVDGKEITSAAYPVNVDVPANGLFVDPINGNDLNDGSLLAPLKTILKALTGLLHGQALYLAPAIFDQASQGGNPLDFMLPQDANVLTYPATGLATLQGVGSGFTFPSGGSIKNVKFDGLTTAVTALAGKFKASGLKFDNVGLPYSFPGSSDSTIDESTVPDFLSNVPTSANGYYLLVANGTSKTALLGPTLNDIRVGVSAVLAKGLSDVTLKGLKATNVRSRIMTIADNAKAHLVDSDITGSGLTTGTGAAIAPVYMGVQSATEPLAQTFEMINSSIKQSPGSAVGLDLLPGVPSQDTISMIGSHLDGNGASGLLAKAPAFASATAGVVVNAAQSTFSNNVGDGLHLERLTGGTITGSNFVSNAGNGIAAGTSLLQATAMSITGSTFASNATNALYFVGSPLSSLDLGSPASPGNNVFSGIPSGYAALNLGAIIQVNALGNTWVPNQQGADPGGKYTAVQNIFTGLQNGENLNQLAGAVTKVF